MFPDIAKGGMEYRLMPLNPVPLSEKEILDILESILEFRRLYLKNKEGGSVSVPFALAVTLQRAGLT